MRAKGTFRRFGWLLGALVLLLVTFEASTLAPIHDSSLRAGPGKLEKASEPSRDV